MVEGIEGSRGYLEVTNIVTKKRYSRQNRVPKLKYVFPGSHLLQCWGLPRSWRVDGVHSKGRGNTNSVHQELRIKNHVVLRTDGGHGHLEMISDLECY